MTILNELRQAHLASYYGDDIAEIADDTPAVCELIQPGDHYEKSSGFTASKVQFSDHDYMRGYSLCTPHDIQRGDRLRYAYKKRGVVHWIHGGAVRWVDGMEAVDGGETWETTSTIRKPKFISMCSPSDNKKRWSIQLSLKPYLWRLPFVTQKDRQAAVEGIEIVQKLEKTGETAEGILSHLDWIATMSSAELFDLARDRQRQEAAMLKQNVKVIR